MYTKRAAFIIILTAFSCIGYTVWWLQAARSFETRIASWIAEQRAQAGFVEYSALRVTGFPLHLTVEATDIAVRLADGVEWRGPQIVARTPPWDITRVQFELPGTQRLILPIDGAAAPVELVSYAGEGHADLTLDGRFIAGEAVLTDLTVGPAQDEATDPSSVISIGTVAVNAQRPEEDASDHTELGMSLGVDAERIRLPVDMANGLGRLIDSLMMDARIMGNPPKTVEPGALAAWRDDGGTIEIDTLDLIWGPLSVDAEGSAALDGDLQPIGALSAEIAGFNQLLDAFVEGGQVRTEDAQLARIALNLLSGRPADGNADADAEPVLKAPLTIQDRRLYLGPVRLFTLPTISWPHQS